MKLVKLFHPFLLLVLFYFSSPCYGQKDTLRLHIRELHTKNPLPFAVVTVNNFENLADLDGNFRFPIKSYPLNINVSHYLYREAKLVIEKGDTTTLTLYLHKKDIDIPVKTSDSAALEIIRLAEQRKRKSGLCGRFRYKCYNKFTVDAERSGDKEKLVEKVLDLLTYDYEYLDSLHLLMMESISDRNIKNFINEKEEITAVRSSGLILPHFYAFMIHPHPVDLSKNYLNLANHQYIGPLCRKPWKTFAYRIVDTIEKENEKIYAIYFSPLPGKGINTVKGLIYISDDGYQPVAISATPAQESKLEANVYQEYQEVDGKSVPYRFRTNLTFIKRGLSEVKITMNARSVLFNYKRIDSLRSYDEVVLNFPSECLNHSDSFWQKHRPEVLSATDSATFLYPPRIKKVPSFMLHLGEHIYFGKAPAGIVDIDLSKVLSLNYQEGLRLGMGLVTNHSFSRRWKFAGYAGYGFKDKRWKYGISGGYSFRHPADPIVELFYTNELIEAARFSFPYNLQQYSTEKLRKYSLSVMDYISEGGAKVYLHPIRYLRVRAKLSAISYQPSYNYTFTPSPEKYFEFFEAGLGFRYAFGEKYIKTPDYEINLGTAFPILWVNYTQSKPFFYNNDVFHRLEIKVQQTLRIFRMGTSGIQLLFGINSKDAPYIKLFNGQGSLRNLSAVSNNSFETMHYNEFLSDRFFALFYSHDFGRIFNPNPKIQPNLVMVHNVGWGSLSRPENHQAISFKTMEKGYFESGLFINNLYLLKISALRTGLGFGFFVRHGPNAHPKRLDNIVFKMAFNFML